MIYTVNAFCKEGQGGNAAGVVLDGSGYTREQKLALAAKLGYSETVFFLPSYVADHRLEYFTPVDEVPLCGHATIAAFALMHQLGLAPTGQRTIQTKAGILRVDIEADGTVMMEQTVPQFLDIYQPQDFSACLPVEWCDSRYPIQCVSTGLKDVIMPIDTPEHLDQLRPQFRAMAELNIRQDVVGIHAFTLVNDSQRTAICRNFAPRYSINEESATGTANCALACYLHRHIQPQDTYIFEQGITMGRPSRIIVKVKSQANQITQVMVGGKGIIVES